MLLLNLFALGLIALVPVLCLAFFFRVKLPSLEVGHEYVIRYR